MESTRPLYNFSGLTFYQSFSSQQVTSELETALIQDIYYMSDRDDSPDSQKGFTNLSLEGFAISIDDEDTQLSVLGETQELDAGEDPCNEASESDSEERKRG